MFGDTFIEFIPGVFGSVAALGAGSFGENVSTGIPSPLLLFCFVAGLGCFIAPEDEASWF